MYKSLAFVIWQISNLLSIIVLASLFSSSWRYFPEIFLDIANVFPTFTNIILNALSQLMLLYYAINGVSKSKILYIYDFNKIIFYWCTLKHFQRKDKIKLITLTFLQASQEICFKQICNIRTVWIYLCNILFWISCIFIHMIARYHLISSSLLWILMMLCRYSWKYYKQTEILS